MSLDFTLELLQMISLSNTLEMLKKEERMSVLLVLSPIHIIQKYFQVLSPAK